MVLKTNAELDILRSIDYWNNQKEGLGVYFLSAINEVMESIQSNPLIYHIRYRHVRVAYAYPFSYGIHYTIEGDVIFVHAVIHTRMQPPS